MNNSLINHIKRTIACGNTKIDCQKQQKKSQRCKHWEQCQGTYLKDFSTMSVRPSSARPSAWQR